MRINVLLLGAAALFVVIAGCDSSDPADNAGCDARTGGAQITFRVVDEEFTGWFTDAPFITEAKRLRAAGETRVPMFSTVKRGSDCDADWDFHVDPSDVEFADMTIELCDGRPSYVDAHLDEWISTVRSWCPWGSEVVQVTEQ